jgi:hypothetical protein
MFASEIWEIPILQINNPQNKMIVKALQFGVLFFDNLIPKASILKNKSKKIRFNPCLALAISVHPCPDLFLNDANNK